MNKSLNSNQYNVDLASHLVVCEANFYRLLQLMPNAGEHQQWGYIIGNHYKLETSLALEIIAVARYTTSVRLTYKNPLFSPDRHYHYMAASPSAMSRLWLESKQAQCTLDIQMYHDANLAEVIAMQQYRRLQARYNYPNAQMHQQDEQARLNTYLQEILSHCLKNGRISKEIFPKMRHSLI